MVSSLFPQLKLAVENNENIESTMSLQKAGEWIKDIVNRVKEMVDRYNFSKCFKVLHFKSIIIYEPIQNKV